MDDSIAFSSPCSRGLSSSNPKYLLTWEHPTRKRTMKTTEANIFMNTSKSKSLKFLFIRSGIRESFFNVKFPYAKKECCGNIQKMDDEYLIQWRHYPDSPDYGDPVFVYKVGKVRLVKRFGFCRDIWKDEAGNRYEVDDHPLWVPYRYYEVNYLLYVKGLNERETRGFRSHSCNFRQGPR